MEKRVCHSWHVLLSPNVWRNFSLFLSFSASTIFFTHPSQETDGFHSMETGNIPGQSWLAESWAQGSVNWNKWRLSTSPSDVYCFVIRQLLCFGCTFFFFFDGEKLFHFFWDNLGQQAASFLTYIIWLLQNHAMLPRDRTLVRWWLFPLMLLPLPSPRMQLWGFYSHLPLLLLPTIYSLSFLSIVLISPSLAKISPDIKISLF